MKFREVALNAATLVTAACAILVTLHVLRSGPNSAPKPTRRDLTKAEWQPLLNTGHRIGPAGAKLTVIEFGDFQCPVCGNYEKVLDTMRARHPRDFAVVFHEFPLPYHPLAFPLARAAECADAQGEFVSFHDLVYRQQASLGVLPIRDLGRLAGLADTARFDRCLVDTTAVPAIDRGIADGTRLGIPGTPAMIVNGSLRGTDLSLSDLEALLRKAQSN